MSGQEADGKRQTVLSVNLGEEQVLLEKAVATEVLGEPFEIIVTVVSELCEIDLLPHLGNTVAIKVTQGGKLRRVLHGHLAEGAFIDEAPTGWRYRLTVRPFTFFMGANIEYRIYQDLTAVEIISKTFQSAGVSSFDAGGLKARQKRTYCVQYGESDFDFISRLMEEEGIYYYFKHAEDGHEMILCDDKGNHAAGDPERLQYNHETEGLLGKGDDETPLDFVTEWVEHVRTSAQSKVVVRDWDFRKPEEPLAYDSSDRSAHTRDEHEVYLGAANFVMGEDDDDEKFGRARAEAGLLARRADRAVYAGTSQSLGLSVGRTVEVYDHDVDRFNGEYLIIRTRHVIVAENYRTGGAFYDDSDYDVLFEAIPATTQYRPLARTPKPRVHGLESAIVTGPAGEVLYTDEYGRVKVQFHWDRVGKLDEKTSCWIRVSQTGGLGNVILPRIGHEVLVDFLGGDPDRPLVVGRVFNANHMPHYSLPDNKTVAMWRTKTVGDKASLEEAEPVAEGSGKDHKDAADAEANEIRFEDKAGEEEIYINANRDHNMRVRHCETHKVGKDQKINVGRDRIETVKRNEKVTIKGKRDYTLTENETEIIEKGNRTTTLQQGNRETTLEMGNDTLNVKMGNITIKAAMGKIEMEAMQGIEIKVGQSSVKIDQTGVTIKGMMLKSEAQAINQTKGVMTSTEGSAMMTVKGAITMIN